MYRSGRLDSPVELGFDRFAHPTQKNEMIRLATLPEPPENHPFGSDSLDSRLNRLQESLPNGP
uniref:Uncharacterized protein n=1 Tax=Arundo donax TaxID=35708 RepID=A0A0A8YKI9_ARUDO